MFGEKLSYLRRVNNITQEELGKFLGYSKNAISGWESGRTEPPIHIIIKIAEYFDVTTDYLLGFNQDDLGKIKRLKIACKEAGISIAGQDFTIEDFERAMLVVETLKKKK